MSQKTGVRPLRTRAWVVEAKLNGVVITLPCRSMASSTHSKAEWPFVKRATLGTPRKDSSSASSCWCFSPMLVSQCDSQSGAISRTYSSSGGIDERVTNIVLADMRILQTLRAL